MNFMGSKMKKGFNSFCNNDTSTSTINHQTTTSSVRPVSSPYTLNSDHHPTRENERQTTLEEMLLQLDMEEKLARREKLQHNEQVRHRMSCVNSSDILRTARNALNQYPRFSLDGKDAMYRSSFRDMSPLPHMSTVGARKSVCCNDRELRKLEISRKLAQNMPTTIAGETVTWCKPGVVAKLMGLEAMPIPLHSKHSKDNNKALMMSATLKRQSLRKKAERHGHEMEKRRGRVVVNKNVMSSSCSTNGYCVMKPVAMDLSKDYQQVGWPMRGGVLYKNHNVM